MNPEHGAVAFLGLGKMGRPMSARLAAAGYAVRGFDADPRIREEVRALGTVEIAGSAAEAADGARIVVLMLPGSDAVAAVLVEKDRLLDRLADGSLVIDMSSSEPMRTRVMAETAGRRAVRYLDAPVSGGVSGAERGTLTIMAGGDAPDLDEATPLFAALGSRVVRCGGHGAGHAVKALNNLMSATHLLVTSEAMLVAQAFDLDPATVLDAVNAASGRSGSTENKWPNFVLTERYDSGFSLALMVKDMTIALNLAAATGAPARLGGAALDLWREAGGDLPDSADHTEIVRWLQGIGSGQASPAETHSAG
ncbi:MAG TPA: NAD(P)-dependent oxidoreductase [Streptosporangiaceae bacterium]|jgi:3-hydroxyisobutyrate dehydrogenase